jgi:hypothetical protein
MLAKRSQQDDRVGARWVVALRVTSTRKRFGAVGRQMERLGGRRCVLNDDTICGWFKLFE